MFLFATLCLMGGAGDGSALKNFRIVYNMQYDAKKDDYEIFSMNPDGSNKRNISNWKGVDWAYHAHGDKVYFVSDRDAEHRKFHLYEMDWDGANVRRITDFLLVDSWLASRKQGREFVVTSDKDGDGHELYLIDDQGRELKRLTKNGEYENDPAFSPDGERIVFRSRRSGHGELYIMDVDGSEWRQITHYPEDDDSLEDRRGYFAGPPFWEPNRNIITFASKRKGNHSLFAVNPDGTGLRQLTPDGRDELWHAWSPDGKWLAFGGQTGDGNYDVWLMPGDGGDIKRLTEDARAEQAPIFVRK